MISRFLLQGTTLGLARGGEIEVARSLKGPLAD